MLTWDDLRIFLSVYRRASHAGAARELRVDPTTVARRLAALEAAVGARLFTRTPEGLAATPAGQALVPHAERVEAEVLDAERVLTAADARAEGTVRMTCGDGMAAYVFGPALPALLAEHPGLRVELRADSRTLDLTRGEADLAVRMFRPRERSLVARRVGEQAYRLYATADYLARRGSPRAVRELASHDILLYDRDFDRMPQQAWLRDSVPDSRIVLRTNATPTLLAACAAGLGVALLPTWYPRADRRLVPVLPGLAIPSSEVWAVTHPDLRGSARITAVMRWVERLIPAAADDSAGAPPG